jgi:uncharacterized membrane protein YkoI
MKRKLVLATIAALTVAAIGSAYAAKSEENDAAALAQTKISLTQAIAAAEQHVNGKAARAELEDENGTIVYGVEVLSGTKTMDVKVDVRDGKILSAQADTEDHEGGAGEREDEGEHGEK